jgi:membrane fusion protein (multidrug efflux system)
MTTSTPVIDAKDPVLRAAARPARLSRTGLVMVLVATAAATAGVGYYVTHLGLETTDDAQIDADVVSVPARTAGVVAAVRFTDNQAVKAGDVLAELDPELQKARLAQAEATLEAAKASAAAADDDARVAEVNARGNHSAAQASLEGASSSAVASQQQIAEGEAQVASATASLARARTDLERVKKLAATGAVADAELDRMQTANDVAVAALDSARARLASLRASTSQARSRVEEANARLVQSSDVDALIDQARSRARTAHAQVGVAQAARDLAALDLSYTKILAPQDGYVSKKSVVVGQMLAPGQGIVQLVPTHDVWITGNFKETQLRKMRVGQPAHAEVDAFSGVTLHGEVESFSAATGARFTLLPPDNASGNYTKVVQRVPVRVHLKDVPTGIALRPGMSVDLTVDTSK